MPDRSLLFYLGIYHSPLSLSMPPPSMGFFSLLSYSSCSKICLPTNTCQLIPRSYRGNVQIPSQTRGLYILHYDYSSVHLISWKTGLLSVINQNAKMGDLSHSYWINVNLFSTHNKVITCVHLI